MTLHGPGATASPILAGPAPFMPLAGSSNESRIGTFQTRPRQPLLLAELAAEHSVNAIAEVCSFEVGLRSNDPGELDKIEVKLLEAVRLGVEEENKKRGDSKMELKAEAKLIGNRPAGRTPDSSPLVQAALTAATAIGFKPVLVFSSTDSNFPISVGIPAITVHRGGTSDNHHSLAEWFEPVSTQQTPYNELRTPTLSFSLSLAIKGRTIDFRLVGQSGGDPHERELGVVDFCHAARDGGHLMVPAFHVKVPRHRSSDADFAFLLWLNSRGRRDYTGLENSSLHRLLIKLRFETMALYSTFVLRSASPSTAETRQVSRPFHSGRALPMPVPESRKC